MHAIYEIRDFFSYKGFNLIKVYFSVKYSACVFYQNFVSVLGYFNSGDTRTSSSDCEIYGVRCNDVATILQRHIFQFPPVRDTADCVSSGRLREAQKY